MNETDRNQLTEIRARCARSDELGVLAGLPSFEGDFDFLLRLIDQHDQRVTELLEANNRELERRRAATGALRRLRQRITGAILDGAPRPNSDPIGRPTRSGNAYPPASKRQHEIPRRGHPRCL